MKWTPLYKKMDDEIYYYNISVVRTTIASYLVMELGNLTRHTTVKHHRERISGGPEEAERKATLLWNDCLSNQWQCAQELGINSNNQLWTPSTSAPLHELLQLTL